MLMMTIQMYQLIVGQKYNLGQNPNTLTLTPLMKKNLLTMFLMMEWFPVEVYKLEAVPGNLKMN